MSNSSLVDYVKISPNRSSPRKHKIDTITIHCVVGQCSVETLGNIFSQRSRNASCNYGIGPDGRIGMYVEEKDRSWCSSNANNDNRAITIECASDVTYPYAINDKVYKSLIKLCVDICKRNGIAELKWQNNKALIGQPDKQNITVHRWFASKTCPGDYIFNRLGKIAKEVNEQLSPKPINEKNELVPYLVKVTSSALNIRRGPGMGFGITGVIRDKGIYTITEEASGKGAKKWGKLKSGKGWISLDFTKLP